MNDTSDWSIHGPKDRQLLRSDWSAADQMTIHGVVSKKIANVLTNASCLTEIWRQEWQLGDLPVTHVFQRVLL